MGFFHTAYAFAWTQFENELAPLLHAALAADDRAPLLLFVQNNLTRCRDFEYGEPLSPNWQDALTANDVQEAADLAITAYYDPTDDFGLGDAWLDLDRSLPRPARAALLGTAFGPRDRLFDPGRMGTYFQSNQQARRSSRILARRTSPFLSALLFRGAPSDDLQAYQEGVQQAVLSGRGLYVTF